MDDITAKDRNKTEGERPEAPRPRARPPRDPWLVDVDVILKDAASDPPEFRLETYLPIDHQDPNQVITFHNCGRPGFKIKFNLIDETGSDPAYRFPRNDDRHEALWSRAEAGCPPKDYGRQWDEFEVERVIEPGGLTLVVRNRNRTVTEFGYTLRVTNDDGKTFVDLDPGGNNQNGNETL